MKVCLITLGCPKNEVDSDNMLGLIDEENRFEIIKNADKADIIIINTCGFINDAKEESIQTILEATELKKEGKCQAVIVTGCLTQRYKEEIKNEIPEIDAILGTGNFTMIVDAIDNVFTGKKTKKIGKPGYSYERELPRNFSDSHYAYVKIAEGCNNNCSYCVIPKIRGPIHSRKLESIYQEVVNLGEKGVKEIILVAQDITRYGIDLYGEPSLMKLLKTLVDIDSIHWIRLMYAYPERIEQKLIDIIKQEDKICNYLDIPVQHASNRIRKLMNRYGKCEDLREIIAKFRSKIPDISLRTSIIVGFPGETKDDFNHLLQFVKEIKFDRLGVFKYSREEGTPAYDLSGQIPERIKQERYDRLMSIQQDISLEKNQKKVGTKMQILIDEIIENEAVGRSQYDAPEIDNQIYVKNANLQVGDFVKVKIIGAYEYDLIGEKSNELTK